MHVYKFECFAGGQESLPHVEGVCRCACVRRVQGRIAFWEQQVSHVAILFILHIVFNKVGVIEESNKRLQKALGCDTSAPVYSKYLSLKRQLSRRERDFVH